jgi:hypothetical protein
MAKANDSVCLDKGKEFRAAMSRRTILTTAALTAIVGLSAPSVLASAAHQDTIVNWHAQQGGQGHAGQVPGAWARLVRNANGISYRINTRELTPGDAYTLWLIVVNEPSACAATPCSAVDILTNPATDSQVRYAAGHLAGASGNGTLAGSVKAGPLDGWLADRAFWNVDGAEIQLVVNDHGPMLPAYLPGMIQTYRGGCSDASPFPGVFPPAALGDGPVGPNICRLFQAAVFLP